MLLIFAIFDKTEKLSNTDVSLFLVASLKSQTEIISVVLKHFNTSIFQREILAKLLDECSKVSINVQPVEKVLHLNPLEEFISLIENGLFANRTVWSNEF